MTKCLNHSRTVKSVISEEILASIINTNSEFEINDNWVTRGANFKTGNISPADLLMIDAAKHLGTGASFLDLRAYLVNRGLTSNYSQVLMIVSPLWTTIERGVYRFIGDTEDLQNFNVSDIETPVIENEEGSEYLDENGIDNLLTVSLAVKPKHIAIGKHKLSELSLPEQSWQVTNTSEENIGTLTTKGSFLFGLNTLFKSAGIKTGENVLFEFSEQEKAVILSWGKN